MALISNMPMFNPPRDEQLIDNLEHFSRLIPFGCSTAVNVLEFFQDEIFETNVLLLGCGDLRNALMTSAKLTDAYHKLNIHFSDISESTIARNILMVHIILSDGFDPANPTDMQYLWNVWYELQWNEATKNRFIKDVKQLLDGKWPACLINTLNPEDGKILKKMCRFGLEIAANITWDGNQINSVLSNRLKAMMKSASSPENVSVQEKLKFLKAHSYSLSSSGHSFRSSFTEAIDCFINTGNCTPVNSSQIVCLNPTLLKVDKEHLLEVNISSNPFEAYFPVPFNGDSAECIPNTDIYSYCQEELGSLVSELIKNKDRVQFDFHFGDCLELCLYNEDMKKKFHVIHCSMVMGKNIGLPDLFTAAKECLSNTTDAAAFLTSFYLPYLSLPDCSPIDFIEMVLCCPLSMVPTLYGMKLDNHLQLGSPVCVKLHDSITKSLLTLKWTKALDYSTNIKLDCSRPLKEAIGLLAALRFLTSSYELRSGTRLLTYYHVVKSLVERCRFVEDVATIQSYIQTDVLDYISRKFHLVWRAEKAWMNGEPVLAYSFGKSRQPLHRILEERRDLIKITSSIRLSLISTAPSNVPSEGLILQSDETDQWIDLISRNEEDAPHYSPLTVKDLLNPSFTFFLPKDHGLESSCVCITILEESGMNSDESKDCLMLHKLTVCCEWKVISNPTPFSLQPIPFPPTAENECGLQVLKCAETQYRYEMDISVRGLIITDVNDVIITTDRENPSWSAHQVTLTLPNVTPLVLQVPWPFLSNEVQISLHIFKNKKGRRNRIRLVLIKSLHDLWPKSSGSHSKWDINRFASVARH